MPLTRRTLLQRLAAAGLLATTPAGVGRAVADQASFFRIGTGSTGGTYFPIGSLLASVISNPPGSRGCDRGGSCGVPGLIAVAQSTEGSVANVAAIAGGRLESGLCQADVAFWAFHGEAVFEGNERVTKLRTLANLYPEAIQLVVRADAGIRSVEDLKGKRISVDREGSGTLVDARLVLAAYGLDVEDLEARYLASGQAVELMRKGELEGLFLVAGTPTAAIAGLAETTAIQLVPISGEEAIVIEQSWPFFSHTTIQSGTYRGVAATRTLSVGAQWLVSADLPDDLVTGITAALWHPASRRLLDTGHPKGRLIELDTALNSLGVPLHPGALAYYEQRGITFLDEEYDPAEEPSTSELDVVPQLQHEGFGEIE
ncbi:TAXI family TRAP transporter solute-binding subunit [Algihabitans albus]|uniref:TAXI family TRAP transporter solute-binding subunit n=1 Tax=Algihabitans albus TaxID=2164067 RepID=UPI001ABBFBE0|nr:TAXI family TRAP transporter solute-binding subunit [Algihabitans albus]